MVNPYRDDYRIDVRDGGYGRQAHASPTEYDEGQLTCVPSYNCATLRVGRPSAYKTFSCFRTKGRALPDKPRNLLKK